MALNYKNDLSWLPTMVTPSTIVDVASTGTLNNVATSTTDSLNAVLRFTGAAPTVTGLQAGRRLIYLMAVGGPLVLANESGSSLAANRIVTGTGANVTIAQGGAALLLYDPMTTRWRLAGGSGGGDGGTTPTGTGFTHVTAGAQDPSAKKVDLTASADVTVPSSGVVKSNGSALSSGTVALGSEVSGTLPVGSGGTGQTSFASGVLKSNGTTFSSGQVDLTSQVTGALPGANMAAATTGAAGSMSAADKTKLDGIQKQGSTTTISALSIDWSLSGTYEKTLASGASTFTFANATDGQSIVVVLTSHASGSTVTWPTVKWAGGTVPTMSTPSKTDIYTFVKIGSTIYGSVVQAMA